MDQLIAVATRGVVVVKRSGTPANDDVPIGMSSTAGIAEPKGDMATAFGRMRGGAGEGYSWLIFPARL